MASGLTGKANKAADQAARALAAYRAGDLDGAERLARAMQRSRPGDRQGAMLTAAIAFARGSYFAAADGFRRVLARHPDDREAMAHLGMALARLDEFGECYAVLRRGEPWSERPDLAIVLAEAAIRIGADDAEARVEALERGHPNRAMAALLRGEFEGRRGHWRESLAACARGAELTQDDPAALAMLLDAAYHGADDAELDRILARARRKLRVVSYEPLVWRVAAAEIRLGRVDAAERFALDMRERSPEPLQSWNTRIDRLVVDGQYDAAIATLETAVAACGPTSAAGRPPRKTAPAAIRRVVIDNGHQVMRTASAEDIAEACGRRVETVTLRGAAPETFAGAGTLVVYASGIDPGQSEIAGVIKASGSGCTIAAWHFDNHHSYLWNVRLAAEADASFPAHVTARDYLARWARSGLCGPIVPLCVTQWPRHELARLYADERGEGRADVLSGRFAYYPIARRRNRLVEEVRRQWPAAEFSLGFRFLQDYHMQSPRDRFLSWRRYKSSLVLPVLGDLSNRFFDALAAGQVPIVPRDILDFDRVIPPDEQASLPVVRLEEYTVDALRAAHAAALAAFDRGGEAKALERHRYALERHMLAHRIRDIVAAVEGAQ